MTTTVLNRPQELNQQEFLNSYTKVLEDDYSVKKNEIEELTLIAAKNPVDRFVISEKPEDVIMQGDLLIWSDITEQYKENFPRVTNLTEFHGKALQEDDSITGDHELVTLKTANYTLKKGNFIPKILEGHIWGAGHSCKILEIDSPFIIKHREHGNFTFLEGGKYMICSSLDSRTLTRMID